MNENLKSLRGKKLMTQQEVADKMGISRQTYNNYETDIFNITLNKVFEILQALDATSEEMSEFFYELQQDKMS